MGDTIGYPGFNTGSSNWDNALGSLARGLFPDPSQRARGLAYGAQARENLLAGDKTISERNAGIAALMQARQLDQGSTAMPPAPSYHPSGVPGGAPIMDPPGNLPMSNGQGAPITPTQLYNATAGSDGHTGPMLAGTPPPMSPPSAVSPPAPNTTASNGSVPTEDTGSGPLHPGSVTPPGGGQKYAPPAQSNGSPAPISPGLNLATYVAMQAMAGRDATQAHIQGLAFLTSAFQQGIIDHNTFAWMTSGLGNNGMFESEQATTRVGMQQAGETGREGMRLRQQESQFGRTTQANQVTQDAQGNPVVNLPPAPGDTALRPVGTGFNQGLTEQSRGITTTGGGGPYGSGPVLQRQGAVQPGTPGFSAETDRQMNTPVQVVVGGVARDMTYGEYLKIPVPQRPPLSEKDAAAVRANTITQAISTGDTGPAGTARRAAIAAEPPKMRTEEEAKQFNSLIDATMQRRFAPVEGTPVYATTRGEPALIGDDTRAAVGSRAQDLLDQGVVRNPDQAINQAIDELTQTGHILTPDQLQKQRGKGTDLANPNIRTLQTGKGAVKVFHVPLAKPYEPGAVQLAPAGLQEGTLSKDRKYQMRNGFWYPYQQ